MICSCHESKHKYEPVGQVITGDLGILKDRKLRELIGKGSSYQEQNNINSSIKKRIGISTRKHNNPWKKKILADEKRT